MNLNRYYSIVSVIYQELQTLNIIPTFQALITALQNQINQPQAPAHQQQVSEHLKQLRENLNKAPSNLFTPAWKLYLSEYKMENFLGTNLLNQINNIFAANQITPSSAHSELSLVFNSLNAFNQALNQIITGFGKLSIEKESLQPGECEVGVMIPRKSINNKLTELTEELKEVNFILNTFEELSTQKINGIELRSISSSDPSFFFNIDPKTAAFITLTIERLLAFYKNLLEVRKLRKELKESGVPQENLKGIDDHANQVMSKGIEEIIPVVMKEFSSVADKARENELKVSLRVSLNKIANRIDRGYNFEVRAEPIQTEKTDEEATEPTAEQKYISRIRDSADSLQYLRPAGDPLLSLPENIEKSKQSNNPETDKKQSS